MSEQGKLHIKYYAGDPHIRRGIALYVEPNDYNATEWLATLYEHGKKFGRAIVLPDKLVKDLNALRRYYDTWSPDIYIAVGYIFKYYPDSQLELQFPEGVRLWQ